MPAGPSGATGSRRALIIANDTYDHPSLGQLRAPQADSRALADVLGDPEVGGFDVSVVHNAASYEVQAHIDDLFADSRPDDLLLVHFSGHGLKSDAGELFIAARNTRPDRLGSTAVAADFIQRCMRGSRARSVVLFLDCCYGGAFGQGVTVRAAGPVNVMDSFPAGRLGGGRGRAVISASSAMEYAFEGTTLASDLESSPSVFTSAVVEGLRTGDADRDEDGLISLNELYDYVFDRVKEVNPRQTPGRDVEMSGELYLARSRRRRLRAVPIPDAIAAALREPDPTYRRGAVSELRDRLAHPDLAVALGALEALRSVASTDAKVVADDASSVIAWAAPQVSPPALDFGELAPDAVLEVHRELRVAGVPLAREVSVETEPPLAAVADGGLVTVTFSPTGRSYAGSLTVSSPTGSVVVPVTASVVGAASAGKGLTGGSAVSGAGSGASSVQGAIGERPAAVPPRTEPAAAAARIAERETERETERDTEGPSAQPRHRLRVVAGLTAIVGGMFLFASLMLPWRYGQTFADDAPGLVLTMVTPGLMAVAAGITMFAPRVRTEVALGFLLAVSAVAGATLLGFAGELAALSTDAQDVGASVAVVGLAVLVAGGVVAVVVAAWRNPVPIGRVDWRDPGSIAAVLLGGITTILIATFAAYLGSIGDTGYQAGVAYVWAVLTMITTVGAVLVHPAAVGRVVLAAWAIGTLGYSLSQWVALTSTSELHGLPVLVVAGLALAVAAVLIGRRDGRNHEA